MNKIDPNYFVCGRLFANAFYTTPRAAGPGLFLSACQEFLERSKICPQNIVSVNFKPDYHSATGNAPKI